MALVVEMILRSTGSPPGNGITSCSAPDRGARGTCPGRFFSKASHPAAAGSAVGGAADPAQSGGQRLAVLPEAEFQGVALSGGAMPVWSMACGKAAVIASTKLLRPSTTAIRMCWTLRTFGSLITESQHRAPAFRAIRRFREVALAIPVTLRAT